MLRSIRAVILFFLLPAIAFPESSITLLKNDQLTFLLNRTGYPTPLSGKESASSVRAVFTGGFDGFPGDGQGWGGSPAVPIYIMASGQNTQGQTASGSSSRDTFSGLRYLINCLFGWITGGLLTAGQENDPPDEQNRNQNRDETTEELEAFREMLVAIDNLLAQSQQSIALVTDMDGTILPHDYESGSELRRLFNEYLSRWRQSGKLLLIIVTRADIRSATNIFFSQHGLPEPDVLISAPQGRRTTVRFRIHPDCNLAFPTLPAIVASHQQVVATESQITIIRFQQFSDDMNRSGLEIKSTKGSLIAWLFKLLSINDHIVISAGDTVDDLGLLQSARTEESYTVFLGIVVGNAEANLRGFLRGRDGIHLSSRPCLFGVVEGIHLGLRRLAQSSEP